MPDLPVIRPAHAERVEVYAPEVRPGFTAWVTAFEYGDGSIGVSFKETIQATNPDYEKPTLEMGEAAGSPVSYGAIDFASPDLVSERVYLRTTDGVTYTETGRCRIEDGAFTNFGFPDGRIIGLEVRRVNETRTGWSDYIDVRESTDGGSTRGSANTSTVREMLNNQPGIRMSCLYLASNDGAQPGENCQ